MLCVWTRSGNCSLFLTHFPTHTPTHTLSTLPLSQRIQKKLLCFQPSPLPRLCPSHPRSRHMETIQLDLNSSVHLGAHNKDKRLSSCLLVLGVINNPDSWLNLLDSSHAITPILKRITLSWRQVSKQLYSCQNTHKPLVSHSPWGNVFPDKEHDTAVLLLILCFKEYANTIMSTLTNLWCQNHFLCAVAEGQFHSLKASRSLNLKEIWGDAGWF